MTIIQFVYITAKPFRWRLLFFLLVSICIAINVSLRPYLLKCTLDSVALEPDANVSTHREFLFYILLYFALLVTIFIIDIIYEYIVVRFVSRFKVSIGDFIFKDLIGHSSSFYQNQFAGSLGNKLNNCMSSMPRIIRILNEEFFRRILAISISSYVLWYIDFRCSLALITWISIYNYKLHFTKRYC